MGDFWFNWDEYWCAEIEDYCMGHECIQMEKCTMEGDLGCRINRVMVMNWEKRKVIVGEEQ